MDFVKEVFKKMSALNYLRKRGASPTLEEDELLAERVKKLSLFLRQNL